MIEAILDASAVLAVFLDEPGRDTVLGCGLTHICSVNYAEIVGKMIDFGGQGPAIDAAFRSLHYVIAPFDEPRAATAAEFRRDPSLRRLSLGDRACLSLALHTGLPVLTTDRAWAALDLGVDVRLIR